MALDDARLVAFVPSTDLERARAFYEGVLGLAVEDSSDFALVVRSGSTMLRITRVGELVPHPFTVLGWDVAELDRARDALVAAGVDMLRYDGMPQDGDGVWTAPSGARIVWFHDPDGNTLSLTQF